MIMNKCIRFLVCMVVLAGVVVSQPSFASESTKVPVSVTGEARSMAGDLLYKEFHRMGAAQHQVDYQKPDGKWLAHKQISYDDMAGIVSFELEYPETKRREVVKASGGAVDVDIKSRQNTVEHQLKYRSGDVIDAGFDRLIKENWNRVEKGEAFDIRFLLFRRGSWMDMKVRPADLERCRQKYDADMSHCLSIRPDSVLLRMLVPTLLLGYNRQKQLMLYIGPSNLKLEQRKPSSLVITYQYPAHKES